MVIVAVALINLFFAGYALYAHGQSAMWKSMIHLATALVLGLWATQRERSGG